MPYNTAAIPPQKELTGHAELPLSRVKKIISQDADIAICSKNAAFIITCAAELFIQHLTDAAHTQVKLERKPRRNIQYKDLANAVSHHDNLEFLSDIVPKTVPFRKVRAAARETQARLRGEKTDERRPVKSRTVATINNGTSGKASIVINDDAILTIPRRVDDRRGNPSDQLELEVLQVARGEVSHDEDVHMSG